MRIEEKERNNKDKSKKLSTQVMPKSTRIIEKICLALRIKKKKRLLLFKQKLHSKDFNTAFSRNHDAICELAIIIIKIKILNSRVTL